ncbi:Glycosyltransferase-like protein LARGE2 [Rhizoctonia solani]|uniref:Glycosyltransferase-like protein LARGE2 n=2 Tax=Rhizoctonia solani TaxID=456999 RepID=A0A0K6G3M7_9AGAM|nr:Glycosyltransferase-like protein LARGE2 [Rhizoctonia solani]
MLKRLIRAIVFGYLTIAVSYTTIRLGLGLSRNLCYITDFCSEPLSTFIWTNDRATIQENTGGAWSRKAFESKLFDLTLKPSEVIAYYYRAVQEHAEGDVTITTIVTSNRFEALARLVEQYQGPISAAVHISSSNTTRRANLLASLHDIYTSSPLFTRWVDVHLITDTYDRQFNMWRNVARLYARTEWVVMLDVDFAVCTDVRGRFRGALEAGRDVGNLVKSGKAAFVIPAFEHVVQEDGKDWKTFPRNKRALMELVRAGKIAMFHQSWAPGHNSTDYVQYYAAQPGQVYRVTTYQKSYEPYVIMRRDGPPWCDERFVGYGGNKAACLFSIYLSGIDFYVLPDDFLIHQSHAKINKYVYDDFRKELCLEQIAQSLQANTLHTDEKYNLRVECMRTPGVPEIVLKDLLKADAKEKRPLN